MSSVKMCLQRSASLERRMSFVDKSDYDELDRAINSMFRWYRNAAKCYVYLTDVSTCSQDTDNNLGWELAFPESR